MRFPDCQTVVFCDTAAKCQSAAATLGACPVLVLDCEGHNLVAAGGTLSIIVLRSATADARTYLIDVPHLSPTSLQPVADLLRAPAIRKVVFDGRMLSSAAPPRAARRAAQRARPTDRRRDVPIRAGRDVGDAAAAAAVVSQDGRAAHAPAAVRAGAPAEQSGRVHCGARGRPEKHRENRSRRKVGPGPDLHRRIRSLIRI